MVKYRDHACFKRILVHAHIYVTYTHALSSTHVAPVRARAVLRATRCKDTFLSIREGAPNNDVQFSVFASSFLIDIFSQYHLRVLPLIMLNMFHQSKNFVTSGILRLYIFPFLRLLCSIRAIPISFCPMLRLPLFTYISLFFRWRDLNGYGGNCMKAGLKFFSYIL